MKDEMEKKNVEDVEQVETNTDESRRTFLKGTASAIAAGSVLGASLLTGVDKVNAQDAKPGKFSTPDWKTLKPGKKDTDLYTEESGFDEKNPDITWWSGRNIGGVTIGLVQVRANLPMMPGNMGNASTFDFPMLYREMSVDNVFDMMKPETTQNFTDGIVEAKNSAGTMYSLERLIEKTYEYAQEGCESFLKLLLKDHFEFTSGLSLKDDITLLILDL